MSHLGGIIHFSQPSYSFVTHCVTFHAKINKYIYICELLQLPLEWLVSLWSFMFDCVAEQTNKLKIFKFGELILTWWDDFLDLIWPWLSLFFSDAGGDLEWRLPSGGEHFYYSKLITCGKHIYWIKKNIQIKECHWTVLATSVPGRLLSKSPLGLTPAHPWPSKAPNGWQKTSTGWSIEWPIMRTWRMIAENILVESDPRLPAETFSWTPRSHRFFFFFFHF